MSPRDKTCSLQEAIGELRSGMTVGIGGWAARRKPMALVHALARSPVEDLRVVSFGGPDVGLLCAAGKVREVVYGFVSLDAIPLEPHFRAARQAGQFESAELDEGMLRLGLMAACYRLPFLPTRAGLGSSVPDMNPGLRTVANPYDPEEILLAMPALELDAALLHVHRADRHGNAAILSPDPFFDDLFAGAAQRTWISCEQLCSTAELQPLPASMRLRRDQVQGVIHLPGGAHFTECLPDYPRDAQALQRYARSARAPSAEDSFLRRYLGRPEPWPEEGGA